MGTDDIYQPAQFGETGGQEVTDKKAKELSKTPHRKFF